MLVVFLSAIYSNFVDEVMNNNNQYVVTCMCNKHTHNVFSLFQLFQRMPLIAYILYACNNNNNRKKFHFSLKHAKQTAKNDLLFI